MFDSYQREVKKIIEQAWEITWYYRGGIQYEDAFELTGIECSIANEKIQEIIKQQVDAKAMFINF